MARILAIANIKGGVGKTTTTANLAAALVERGRRVLVVDLDPQSSLTLALGVRPTELTRTVRDALEANAFPAQSLVVETQEGISLLPANYVLRGIEPELEDGYVRLYALRDALGPLAPAYDYCLLDCPANAGILTNNALAAADQIIIPLPADFLALETIPWLLTLVKESRQLANPRLEVAGFLLTMYDPRTRHTREVVEAAHKRFGLDVPFFSAVVRTNTRLREAPARGQTIFRYAPDSPAVETYRLLAAEVEEGICEPETDAYALVRRGNAALAWDDKTSAYADFCQAIEIEPLLAEAWLGRAETAPRWTEQMWCYAKTLHLQSWRTITQNAADALLDEKLPALTADDIPETIALGYQLESLPANAYAEKVYRGVVAANPDFSKAWLGLARTTRDPKEAVACCERVLAANPGDAAAVEGLEQARARVRARAAELVEMGLADAKAGDRVGSRALFSTALNLDPENDRAWLGLARSMEDPDLKREYAAEAVSLNPENEEARELQRWLWVPEKESVPVPWGSLASIVLGLIVFAVLAWLIYQRYGPQ